MLPIIEDRCALGKGKTDSKHFAVALLLGIHFCEPLLGKFADTLVGVVLSRTSAPVDSMGNHRSPTVYSLKSTA